MTSVVDTRTRLLESAEQLFAEYGLSQTTVRMITERAGANVAAVNYHFDGKDGLIREVLERRVAEIETARIRHIEAASAKAHGEGRKLTTAEVSEAFLRPLIEFGFDKEGKVAPFMRLIQAMMSDPVGPWPAFDRAPPAAARHYREAVQEALGRGEIPEERFALAFTFCYSVGFEGLAIMARGLPPTVPPRLTRDDILAGMVAFTAAGLERMLAV